MKFLTTNTALVMVILIIMTVVSSLNAADDSNARRSSLRLRSSISSSSSSSSSALSSSSKINEEEVDTAAAENDNDNDNDGKETEKQEERDELQNFWASEIIADIDSMVITKAPTPAPTTSLGPSSKVPNDDTLLNTITLEKVLYSAYPDENNDESYTTFCRAGQFTNVQIVSLAANEIFCITNTKNTSGLEFGYERDFPFYPTIRLNLGPPKTCGDDEDEDEDEDEDKDKDKDKDGSDSFLNYCGFRGKPTYKPFNSIVTKYNNTGTVNINLNNIGSYTTYCQENKLKNVRAVTNSGTVECITSELGSTINLFRGDDNFVTMLNISQSDVCDYNVNNTNSNSRFVTDSFPCGYDGVANTVYPNFPSDDNDSDDDFYYN